MKLDYLQFLELEVFSRFGQRLEVSMEARIKRGRNLREILKQDRLAPLSAEFQLAWLLAFNEGLFDQGMPDDVKPLLVLMDKQVQASHLNLDSDRQQWLQALNGWLEASREKQI